MLSNLLLIPEIESNFKPIILLCLEYSGLYSKNLGSKLQNIDFLSATNNYDFMSLTEIGNYSDLEIAGYKSFVQGSTPNQSRKGGRNSEGIVLFYKKNSINIFQSRKQLQILYGLKLRNVFFFLIR